MILEAVPNFSEGRELEKVRGFVDALSRPGTEVLDYSADPDHNRSVVTLVGEPSAVEGACVAAAELARDTIDMRLHRGIHPRIGALDVLPFVPIAGMTMADAVDGARRVGRAVADLGIPVYLYGHAARPPARSLAQIRHGGFEALAHGFPAGREPDLWPRQGTADRQGGGSRPTGPHPHPSAGATCVGARKELLAWNVYLDGVSLGQARGIAARVRERDGGFPGLRALAVELPSNGRIQLSMNLEDAAERSAGPVFDEIQGLARRVGGRAAEVEVIGMATRDLAELAESGRLNAPGLGHGRVLESRI